MASTNIARIDQTLVSGALINNSILKDVTGVTEIGAEFSLSFGATGKVTTLAAAARSVLHIPNQAMAGGGVYTPLQCEVYSDGSASDPAGMTTLAFIRVLASGDAAGIADVDDDAVLFSWEGFTAGAGNLISAAGNEPTWTGKTRQIRCKLPSGSLTYLLAVDP